MEKFRDVRGVKVPAFLYGTAWKEDRTEELTKQALLAGFTGIDTANQRRHYFEAGVGSAVQSVLGEGKLSRGDLFLQTKFTYARGQDARLPYDPTASLTQQVRQSFQSSLEHLGTSYIDSYVLHGPSRSRGLGEDDREVWQAMEALHESGKTKLLGVSNVALDQLEALCRLSRVEIAFVQNRCFARTGWDRGVRQFCRERGIVYQGFSLLTANEREIMGREVRRIAERHGKTVPQVVFNFALQLGMLPLTGTSDAQHMAEDLASLGFELDEDEVESIERIAG
jgi:diketogulonate reductase-like aldo/keto reductase